MRRGVWEGLGDGRCVLVGKVGEGAGCGDEVGEVGCGLKLGGLRRWEIAFCLSENVMPFRESSINLVG